MNRPAYFTRLRALALPIALTLLACLTTGCEKLAKKPAAQPAPPPAASTDPAAPVPGSNELAMDTPVDQLAAADDAPLAESGDAEPEGLPILSGFGKTEAPSAPAKSHSPEDSPEYGKVEPGKSTGQLQYTNPFFQFTLDIPDRYHTAIGLELGGVANKGTELLAGDDGKLRERIKANRPKSFRLLATSEQPLDVPQERNPTIMVVAERLDQPMTGQQYLEQCHTLLTNGLLSYARSGEIVEEQRGNRTFFIANYKVEKMDVVLLQSYVVTLRKGHALTFIITDTRPENLAALRTRAMLARFEPIIGEAGVLADGGGGTTTPETETSGAHPPMDPGGTLLLREEDPEAFTLPELPTLNGPGSTAVEPPLEESTPPTEFGVMTPRVDPSPDSRPVGPIPGSERRSGVPAPALPGGPPLPPTGRATMPGADEMGATPLSIEPEVVE